MKTVEIYFQEAIRISLIALLTFCVSGFHCASAKDKNTKMLKNINFKVNFSKESADSLVIRYEITNNSNADIFLLNKGDTFSREKNQAVYIEPQKNGIIQIMRGGLPNAPTPDRSPTFPIEYGVTQLAPKETFKDEFSIALPLQPYSPFRSYTNNPIGMPNPIREIQFCLGVIENSKIKIKTSAFPVLDNYTDIVKQKILCSENFKLN